MISRRAVLLLCGALLFSIGIGPGRCGAPRSWPARFVPLPPAPTGSNSAPVGLGVARLFGGGPDLVVADAVRGLILLRNDGPDGFHEAMALPAGSSATCVGAGDLTGGPVQSLAAANMLDTFLSVFLPQSGGGFAREDIPTGASPLGVTVVGLPGEARAAVVVGLGGRRMGQLRLLRRTSAGWQAGGAVDLPWIPMGITAAALDAGATPDLIVAPTSGRSVAVVQFLGPDTLEVREILPASHLIAAAAGAGAPGGALVVGVGRTTATVWRRAGAGTFQEQTTLEADEPLTGVALADLNGDGWPDIIATSTGHLLVWPGRPDGGFGSPRQVAPAYRGFSPVVADFDGDGRPDIAWNNSIWRSVSVLRNATPDGHPGDGNGDGVVDLADVALALKASAGLARLAPPARARLDVAPIRPDGSWGDTRITVEDAVRILRWAALGG